MKGKTTSPARIGSSLPVERVTRVIYMARGEKVMLGHDLALLYSVETRVLNQAVRRNRNRFPPDFMFELTRTEIRSLADLRDDDFRHSKAAFAFTEHGVAMLSSVLRSEHAVQVNIAIMRAFVQLRRMLATHADLAMKIQALEAKYDARFKRVFALIEELTTERRKPKREIGFHALMPKLSKTGGTNVRRIDHES